jgi:O-antigen/teichoic acid export membrane protein
MKNTKNILILIVSRILLLLSSFAVFICIAQIRDKDFLGTYALVMTWMLIFRCIASMGIGEFIVREIGRNPEDSNKLLVHGLSLGLFSSILFVGLMLGSVLLFHYPQNIESAIFVSSLAVIPLTLSSICEAGFIAHKKVVYNAYISVFENVATMIISIGLILKGYGVISLVVVFVILRCLGFVINLLTLYYKVHPLHFNIRRGFYRKLIPGIAVFGMITILSTIFFRIDIIMLSKIKDTDAVAAYAAAGKIMEALLIIPMAFLFIYLPIFAKELRANHKYVAEELYFKIIRALLIIVVPLALGITYFAEPVIRSFYGDQYYGSVIALQILMLAFFVLSMDIILGMLCKAGGFQKIDLYVVIINVLINIFLNLILIPPYGYVGASLSTVISICISLSLHHIFVNKNVIHAAWWRDLGKPFVTTFLALLLLHPLSQKLHFVTHAMLFGIGYVFILVLIKGISIHEIKSLMKILPSLFQLTSKTQKVVD